jgi:hypothetical protein
MFDSTIPFGEPELVRASGFRRYLPQRNDGSAASFLSPQLASLSPSLMADLGHGPTHEQRTELLDVMAACVRHAQPVTVHLQCSERAVPMTLFPHERLLHCPIPIDMLLAQREPELQVIHIEPALLAAPGEAVWHRGRPGPYAVADLCFHPLGAILWDLALHGGRHELLPEITGPAVYRVSYGLDMGDVTMSGTLLSAVYRLRRESCRLRDVASWPGFDRERAVRLLNGLYLQSGLIVSRSHPDALRDSWFGALGPR